MYFSLPTPEHSHSLLLSLFQNHSILPTSGSRTAVISSRGPLLFALNRARGQCFYLKYKFTLPVLNLSISLHL